MRNAWLIPLPALVIAACGSPELPPAANGTNLAACAAGSCEVRVKSGDQLPNRELGPITVVVRDDRITLSAGSGNDRNGFSLSAEGTAGKNLVLNGHRFHVVAVLGDQGVLRAG
ncbi:hypothetical protein [Amycolatopsis samaneae]|uniref:Lipoprotein n=1 Tax=Amycolatopsis samaneae TaxID=664691 RepID=A0ABW5GWL8_9PSEU